jgi:Domain of unknown function DUF29
MNKHAPPDHLTPYDSDYFVWSQRQAELIRNLTLKGLDAENVAEEIESLGKRDRRELLSLAQILFLHLLKWQYQPRKRSKSWQRSINNARKGIDAILSDSPSLRTVLASEADSVFIRALREAVKETGLPANVFPVAVPYSLVSLLDIDYLPE